MEHELVQMDGYDDCIVGVVERYGMPPILCYDKDMVLEHLMVEGMSLEEAEEFFFYNQIGAWWGDSTPCFITSNGRGRQKGTQDG